MALVLALAPAKVQLKEQCLVLRMVQLSVMLKAMRLEQHWGLVWVLEKARVLVRALAQMKEQHLVLVLVPVLVMLKATPSAMTLVLG